MTKALPALLEKTKKSAKVTAIESLFRLFHRLRDSKIAATVNDLKKNGPAEFADTYQQEDAHQYLISLMSMLEL